MAHVEFEIPRFYGASLIHILLRRRTLVLVWQEANYSAHQTPERATPLSCLQDLSWFFCFFSTFHPSPRNIHHLVVFGPFPLLKQYSPLVIQVNRVPLHHWWSFFLFTFALSLKTSFQSLSVGFFRFSVIKLVPEPRKSTF